MPDHQRAATEQQATYLSLIGLFLSLLGFVSTYERRRHEDFAMRPFDFVLLTLATYRAGQLIATDRVAAPLREPVTTTERHAGEQQIVPRGVGARRALGELVSCSTCAGTWSAAALVYGLRIAPVPTRLLLAILSATGCAELLEKGVGALSEIGHGVQGHAGD